jgi:hypothetical protein
MQLKNMYRLFTLLILISIITACNPSPPSNTTVSIINHSSPDIKDIDISAFKNVDCTWQSDDYAICNEDGIFKKMGCSTLTSPDSTFNLLNPSVNLISCNYVPEMIDEVDMTADGIYNSGCSRPVLKRLVVYHEGNYQLIKNLQELIGFFAPIDTKEEALAFAIAATGYQPLFQFDPPSEYRYMINNIEDTKVEILDDGYLVNLYHHNLCGCGPHTTFSTPVKVGIDGILDLYSPVAAFEDPSEDDLCVD